MIGGVMIKVRVWYFTLIEWGDHWGRGFSGLGLVSGLGLILGWICNPKDEPPLFVDSFLHLGTTVT